MVWDLGRAMFKKQEFECARLIDFEFRLRARSMRLLAEALGLSSVQLVEQVACGSDDGILSDAAKECGRPLKDVIALHVRLSNEARRQLVNEMGDPTPSRLG